MPDLSILIPARNEMFLTNTIQDILAHVEADTEVLVGLDGAWADPPIVDHSRVTILHVGNAIGQRAMTNKLCALSSAKYVMKVDAHCAFDQGFDSKLLTDMQDTWTFAPTMKNLHAFDWVCTNAHRRYQGPSGPCSYCVDPNHDEKRKPRDACDNPKHAKCAEPTTMDVVWFAKHSPNSTSFCFDAEPHFQYFGDFKSRPEGKGTLTESMSLQGSCFLLTRDRYWALNICDEAFGSWGSQGIEVACKTWLSGGRVMVSHKTWYAHMFRTQGGDFGFPYPLSGKQVNHAKSEARKVFFQNTWPLQTKPLAWLVEKFWPVPGWTSEQLEELRSTPMQIAEGLGPHWMYVSDPGGEVPSCSHEQPPSVEQSQPTRGILYYTDNALNMRLAHTCRQYITASGLPITSVTLRPTNFGRNIVYAGERSYKTMFKQIEIGLATMAEDIVFFCEHDVLYHRDHFDFQPTRHDCWYYNGNWWQLRLSDGFAVNYDISPLAGLVVDRKIALAHFQERNAMIAEKGFGYWMGFEPFTHRRVKWQQWWDYEVFKPKFPNIDIAHGANLTQKRFTQQRFIRKPKFWFESDAKNIPGWPGLPEIVGRCQAAMT